MITSNIEQIIKEMTDFEKKQLPYIMKCTANDIAFDVMNTARKEVRMKFNGQSLASAILVNQATKQNPVAEVFVSDAFRGIGKTQYATPTWKVHALTVLEKGGMRPTKSMERLMVKAGLLRGTEVLIPDGKIEPWVYVQLMSVLHLNWKPGYNANETKGSRKRRETALKNAGKSESKFFVVTTKHIAISRHFGKVKQKRTGLAPGIYARMLDNADKRQVFRLFKIGSNTNYMKRWDLERIVHLIYDKRGYKYFSKAYDYAMFTARR